MRLAALVPGFYNWVVTAPRLSRWVKDSAGFDRDRSLPKLGPVTLAAWHRRHANHTGLNGVAAVRAPAAGSSPAAPFPHGRVYLFCDEFTNFNDSSIGIKAVQLLNRLGYEVIIPEHVESGRAHFSKGLVRAARKLAVRNVEQLAPIVTADAPLIGIEPSAILSFRDEYPDLMPPALREAARALAQNTLLIDEFVAREIDRGHIARSAFVARPQTIKLHGHCHQKSLSSLVCTVRMLELPAGNKVQLIPSGCCGMAGSFGYEAEHFAVSQQIGELVLFPAVRQTPMETLIAAPGTSCRHQIKDGTGRTALHPVEILHAALDKV
jgi:Fe-S oxidoreductase